ncbi:MAG: hypothetical protein L3J82_01890 [Planctomycetes bacterium]|nr:hypothetical protein [Planctomycetota bacterium]
MFLADSFGIIVFLIIAGIVVAIIIASIGHKKKVQEAWTAIAAKYRLKYMGNTSGGLSGNVNGIFCNVSTVTRGSGKNRSTYTVYTAYVGASLPNGLSLTREGFFSKVGKMFGGQDIQTGDRRLDDSLIIKGQDVSGIIRLLTIPQVRDALMYFIARHPGMVVTGGSLYFEEHGTATKSDRMSAAIDDLVYMSKTLEAGVSGPAPQPVPVSREPKAMLQIKLDDLSGPSAVEITDKAADYQRQHLELSEAFSSFKSTIENPTVQKKTEPANNNAFASPTLSEDIFAPTPSAFDSPTVAPEPSPVDTSTEALTSAASSDMCEGEDDIYALIKELKDVDFGGSRQDIIDKNNCVKFNLMVYVDRIDSTFGFDTPDHLKDGKTLEGHLSSGEKVAVRFPKSMNDRISKLHSGGEFGVSGQVTAWDDLFKKIAIDYTE